MADGIFTQDEITASQQGPEDLPPEQPQSERPRDEQGRFAPKEEPQPERQPEAEQRDDKGNLVPQGALHAERERRKEAENRWKTAQGQLDAIAQMRQQVTAATKQAKQPKAPEGDEPGAQIAYLKERIEALQGNQDNITRTQQSQQLDQAEHQQLSVALTTSEAEFRASKPDYDAAINHVVNARAQELALYGLSPVEIQQTLQQEVLDITRASIQQGKSPAEVAYQLATLRGYRPEAGEGQQQQPNTAAAAVQAIQRAQNGSRSLGQAAGAAPPKDLNLQTIASMSQDEFDALYSTPEGKRMIDAL